MAVLRSGNIISQQRVDVPTLRSVESAVREDFDDLLVALITGASTSYVLRGLELNMNSVIGSSASSLQLIVSDSAILHNQSAYAGTFFIIASGATNQVLNSLTNTNVSGSFSPSSLNYIGVEFLRSPDTTTTGQVFLWDPTNNIEITKNLPLAQTLSYQIVISNVSFGSNILPISVVNTDASNNIISITDSRPMLFRLGTAGTFTPDPSYVYPWTHHTEGRVENPYLSTSSVSPFRGGDKQILTQKEWMDAVMSLILEIKGTPFWYSTNAGGSLITLREDANNSVISGVGNLIHSPSTSGLVNWTSDFYINLIESRVRYQIKSIYNFTVLIGAAATLGDIYQDSVTGTYFTVKTTKTAGVGTSLNCYGSDGIAATAPITMQLNKISGSGDPTIVFTAIGYPSDITLANNKVAYVNLQRNKVVSPILIFTATNTVVSIGNAPWTGYGTPNTLMPGDFVKVAFFDDSYYYQIDSVPNDHTAILTTVFAETPGNYQARYTWGVYWSDASPSINRHIYIADRNLVPYDENTYWLFAREDDNGATPMVLFRNGVSLLKSENKLISGNLTVNLDQDRNLALISGGYWTWILATSTLSWATDAYIQIPGLDNSVNLIVAGSNAALNADGMILYVNVNRMGPSGSLTINSSSITNYVPSPNSIIIARRVGSSVIVGDSILLGDGSSIPLYSGGSGGGGVSAKINQAHTFALGDIIYFNTTWQLCDSSTIGKEGIGIVSKIVDSNNFVVTFSGYINNLAGLITNSYYYVSSVGSLSLINSQYSAPIGVAISATELIMLPWRPEEPNTFGLACKNDPGQNMKIENGITNIMPLLNSTATITINSGATLITRSAVGATIVGPGDWVGW